MDYRELRALRVAAGLSQRDLAGLIGWKSAQEFRRMEMAPTRSTARPITDDMAERLRAAIAGHVASQPAARG